VTAVAIDEAALLALIQGEIRRARADGVCHIHDEKAFAAHLVAVGHRAEAIARSLQHVVPVSERPDPLAAFVAGAWHDGGKIRVGDDYHEIAGAVELIQFGAAWGLIRGQAGDVDGVLRRAARALLPHFAIHEQWNPSYTPTAGNRQRIVPVFDRLVDELRARGRSAVLAADDGLLLPATVDALVVMYADLVDSGPASRAAFEAAFERRWRDMERRATHDDPAIIRLLPVVRPRVHAGCALVHTFLTQGYDAGALQRFRSDYCGVLSAA
jgi:hypothetical protein